LFRAARRRPRFLAAGPASTRPPAAMPAIVAPSAADCHHRTEVSSDPAAPVIPRADPALKLTFGG
jgi:hypothetical protein